jgi:monothiol glutaredoxin
MFAAGRTGDLPGRDCATMSGPSRTHPEQDPMSIQDKIREQVKGHPVVLYMKGTPQFPQCGFSATAAEILKRCGVTDYFSVNVLADADVRQGIKEYANWPTIPQLYVNGEFVGGCDIMREMYASGELQQMLERKPA